MTDPAAIHNLLHETVADMLRGGEELNLGTRPSVILVIGVNGVGKTTTIGKIAARLTKRARRSSSARRTPSAPPPSTSSPSGPSVQAPTSSGRRRVPTRPPLYSTPSRPPRRGTPTSSSATRPAASTTKKNLMDELSKISRVIARELPEADKEVLLVLDATTGQNAVNQAREFKNAAGITGIVLTKLDLTAPPAAAWCSPSARTWTFP